MVVRLDEVIKKIVAPIAQIHNQIDGFRPDFDYWRSVYGEDRTQKLIKNSALVDPGNATRILLSMEDPKYFTAGGLSTVIGRILDGLHKLHQNPCFTIHPYFPEIPGVPSLSALEKIASPFFVQFEDKTVSCQLYKIQNSRHDICSLFLAPYASENLALFSADGGNSRSTSPYEYSDLAAAKRFNIANPLARDAVFFCKAAAHAINTLCPQGNIVIHSNDWQTASVAKKIKDLVVEFDLFPQGIISIPHLHNYYDYNFSNEILAELGIPTSPYGTTYRSSLEATLPFFDGPPVAVSEGYAKEGKGLRSNPFVAKQIPAFKSRLSSCIGFTNGNFVSRRESERQLGPEAIRSCLEDTDISKVLLAKQKLRTRFFNLLAHNYQQNIYGNLEQFCNNNQPIFLSYGRNCLQKNFSGIAHAILGYSISKNHYAENGHYIPSLTTRLKVENLQSVSPRFVFCLRNFNEQDPYSKIFIDLAKKFPKQVLVIAGGSKNREDVELFIAAADFALYPSVYEPCGSPSEAQAMGTLAIATAIGGLPELIIDPEFHYFGEECPNPDRQTGILIDTNPNKNLAITLELEYEAERIELCQNPNDRIYHPYYDYIVKQLQKGLVRAINIYENVESYKQVLVNAMIQGLREDSWDENAAKNTLIESRVVDVMQNLGGSH